MPKFYPTMPKDEMEFVYTSDLGSEVYTNSLNHGITEGLYPEMPQIIKLSYGDDTLSLCWNPKQVPCSNGDRKSNRSTDLGISQIQSGENTKVGTTRDIGKTSINPPGKTEDGEISPPNIDNLNSVGVSNFIANFNNKINNGEIIKNKENPIKTLIGKKYVLFGFIITGTLLILGAILGFIKYNSSSSRDKTIYVNPNTNIASIERNKVTSFPTITQALKEAQAGDKIWLQAGDYAATNQVFPFVVPPNVTIVVEPNTTFFPAFRDIKNHWAQNVIQELAMKRIITGFPDGTFQPDAKISRAQYAAMLVQAFNPDLKLKSQNFPDVKSDFWAKDLIQQAYRSGFLVGFPEKRGEINSGNTFQPNRNIRRTEVIVSLVNGLGLNADDGMKTQPDSDESEIPGWAKQQVNIAVTHNLIAPQPNSKLVLNQDATRADVAWMIHQALLKYKIQ